MVAQEELLWVCMLGPSILEALYGGVTSHMTRTLRSDWSFLVMHENKSMISKVPGLSPCRWDWPTRLNSVHIPFLTRFLIYFTASVLFLGVVLLTNTISCCLFWVGPQSTFSFESSPLNVHDVGSVWATPTVSILEGRFLWFPGFYERGCSLLSHCFACCGEGGISLMCR